jgi:hypothetical protein
MIVATKLISMGFCLGIGFWASKKVTNQIDEWLCLYDKAYCRGLADEMDIRNV